MNGGKPSFVDVFSAGDEFVNVVSKHAKVDMFVAKLVNNANPRF